MSKMEYAIITNNLTKKFNDFIAVDNLNLKVKNVKILKTEKQIFLVPNKNI